MTSVTAPFACPIGHPLETPYRRKSGCEACRPEAVLAEASRLLVAAVPSLSSDDARQLIVDAGGSPLASNQLHAWLAENPDALRSGRSECPLSGVRLLAELAGRGVDVAFPRCEDCQQARPLPARVEGGRVCTKCYRRRHAEACGRCGKVNVVAGRDDDGGAVCPGCRNADPRTWRPCGRCGGEAQTIVTEEGVAVGRCCYVQPQLRCTVCGIRKGMREWRTRRPVCSICVETERANCATCGLDAAAPAEGEDALCARCRTRTSSPCSDCGAPTISRTRQGKPRCIDCYRRPVAPCGRCGRVRAISRLARDGDPDLCGVCWRGPVMACEGCGRTRPCRGERKGRMLCEVCRPVTPQACAHCGKLRPPTAHWHEGPVCQKCYDRALAAKAVCPSCGDKRRLRVYPGFDDPVCSDCAGEPPSHVCERCGVEDCLYERGLCRQCVVHRRLTAILGDESTRVRNGLGPLFEALVGSTTPRAVLDWLIKSPKTTEALTSIARGEAPLSHDTMDDLEAVLGVHTARHLESLLSVAGALPARDPVLVATERWSDRFLVSIDHEEHSKVLRAWVRWQVLRPLRDKSNLAALLDTSGWAARGRLKNVAAFCAFLVSRGRSLSTCRQADLDDWASSQTPNRVRSLPGFATWAMARHAMPRLEVPAGHSRPPAAPMATDERWAVARRLLHSPDIDPAVRVGGALVVIYAQPLFKISRIRVDDLEVTAERVVVRLDGGATISFPEPLAGHARALIEGRRPAPTKANLPTDPGWLFPGNVPGRPITPQGLSHQFARHGVRAGHHRLSALYQFAAEMPAPLLADILGVNPRTAEVWSRLASRTWADYPEMRQAEG